MRKRKINRNKPMFKKKPSPARTALNIVLVLALLLALAFLGYSVGKGVTEFLKNRPDKPTESDSPPSVTEPAQESEQPVTSTPIDDNEPVTSATTAPEPVVVKNRILYVAMPENGGFDDYLNRRITYAQENDYAGVCVELLAVGGKVCYATQNTRAIGAKAVAASPIADLSSAAKRISEAGLVPYARVSLLTDNIVSWFDKSVCYLFENSTSTWLDDSAANGGKPWISAFSSGAREYMADIFAEISEAGFEGVIAGEIEFPPFRNSDLNYIGTTVKSADRYAALVEFSNKAQQALGEGKGYAVEIDAQDIVAGRAEILKGLSELDAQTVYVRYDSSAIGTRIIRADESEVSYIGLSETAKLSVVMKSVQNAFYGTDKSICAAVTDASLIPALLELGFEEETIIVY